jgi:hypothetical protein
MQNGNDFHVFIQDSIQFLSNLTVTTYYAEPLPADVDERMQAIVAKYMAAKEAQWAQFRDALAQEKRSLFGIYGHRAATLAAREASRDWLLSGLVGNAISNTVIPERRRVEVGLVVFMHVARKLAINPIDLFEEAAVFATPEYAQTLHKFGRRGNVTLQQFGWKELKTREGLKYKFDA